VDFVEDVVVVVDFKIIEIKEKVEILDDEVVVVVDFKIIEIKEKMEILDDEVVVVVHEEVKISKHRYFHLSISFN
jgi:uncharacterized protein YfkK (UPF0435 family)